MPNCPVCNTKYNEGQEICSSCCWLLTSNEEKITEQINWAKQVWKNKSYFESNYQKLKEEYDNLKAQQTTSSRSETQLKTLEEQLGKTIERVYQLEQSEKKYEQFNAQLEALTSQFNELISKRESEEKVFSEIQEEISKLKNERSQTQEQLGEFETRLAGLEENLRANKCINLGFKQISLSNPSLNQDITSPGQFQPVQAEHHLSLDETNLARKYNRDLVALSKQAIEVNATEESISNLRIVGSSSTVIFEKKRRGNYWILKEGGCEYLVPSNNLRINQHNYKTVETLFECRGFQPESSGDFQLAKPAKVSALSGGETWQLEENGVLQF